jgi:uncharacterized membrane protein YedE/YeeE
MEVVLYLPALTGGVLIGLAATMFLLLNGRIAGTSGNCRVVGAKGQHRSQSCLGLMLGRPSCSMVYLAVCLSLRLLYPGR